MISRRTPSEHSLSNPGSIVTAIPLIVNPLPMRADLDTIIHRGLKPWPNRYDPKRYYVEFWKKSFVNDLEKYNTDYSVFRRQDEVSVYFDTDGFLHIVCKDPVLAERIDRYFRKWYDYVCRETFSDTVQYYHIGLMIEPYCTDLDNGFVQLRYRDKVCNLSPEQLRDVHDMNAQQGMFKGEPVSGSDTGIPRLDEIVCMMLEDGEIWPVKGSFFDSKLSEFGLNSFDTMFPFWWNPYYTPDPRFWSPIESKSFGDDDDDTPSLLTYFN